MPKVAEFAHMSTRPALGLSFIQNYWPEVVAHDGVYIRDRKHATPRYFMDWLEKHRPEDWRKMDSVRRERRWTNRADNTPKRLAVKEEYTTRKQAFFKGTKDNAI